MKPITSILLLSSIWLNAEAQIVNESVNFDNYVSTTDNDFENRFDNGTGLSQIQTNGITGGCLETPQTISWGNDNAIYCTRFRGLIGDNYTTGICFRYDTSQLNSINFDRPVSLWMQPYSDPNHYVIASILGSGQIQIVSYSASGMSGILQLAQDHWYNLILTTDFTGGANQDQININAQVNDLGVTGNDPPLPTGFTNAVLHDSILIADTAIQVSITGTWWGGARYMDNFTFQGLKSFDNCISTGLTEHTSSPDFLIRPEINMLSITSDAGSRLTILNMSGQTLVQQEIKSGVTQISLASFATGVYCACLQNNKMQLVRKFAYLPSDF